MEATMLRGIRRERVGTKYARRLRAQGQLPAIVYGHGLEPIPIALPAHNTEVELHHGARVLHVDLDGGSTQYLIKSVQYDHLGTTPVHLDLMRVNLDERVTVEVGIELRGTPHGVSEGGVLEQELSEIEVECLVTQIPGTLRPSVTHLKIGESLLVKDLELPPGVEVVTDGEERVASVRMLAEEVVEEEEVPEEEGVQPEVITRGKKEEEEEGKGAS
jgi:large subunit ribosomal protein L25